MFSRTQGGFRLVAVFLTLLLAITMLPAASMQTAFADEPDAAATDATSEGLLYKVTDGKATLVGFEEGPLLEGDVVVPESVDGATVTAVEIAEGQVAEGVTSLTLPQTVESVKTEGLASAFPKLSSIEVDGTAGIYSTSGGMLFLQGRDAASSDGSTTLAKNRELVWAPPALVVARLPIECKSIAPGAFVDAVSVETVMCPGVMESIAVAEKDAEGNVTKQGAFTDGQIASLSIVVPGTNIASPSGDRVSASVALSEDEGMEAKREAWWKYGFNSDKIVMGTSFGEVEGVVAVSDDGSVEDASIDVLKPYEKKQLAEAAESGDTEAAARLAAPEGSGLSFSYNADMNLSVGWAGDKTATPATIEIPAYVTIDGVKYAVTEIAPEAFKGAVFLTSVTVPEGVRIIGESAFENCTNLKEVSLPSTLRTIDYATFKGCSALESIDIPESVTYVGGKTFAGCSSLSSLNYARTATVASDAVDDNKLLRDVTLEDSMVEGEALVSSQEIEAYAVTATTETLAAESGIDDLIREANVNLYDDREQRRFSRVDFINSSNDSIYRATKGMRFDYGDERASYAGFEDNWDQGAANSGPIAAGSRFTGSGWNVLSELVATVYKGRILMAIYEHDWWYLNVFEVHTDSTQQTLVDLTDNAKIEGYDVPAFPKYIRVSPTTVETSLDIELVEMPELSVRFDHDLAERPNGFTSQVRCKAGVDLTRFNPSDDFNIGWGIVNADGSKDDTDQRDGSGRLIAATNGAHYFAMWEYRLWYYNKNGSERIDAIPDTRLYLNRDDIQLPRSNGIPNPQGYSSMGWAPTKDSAPAEGYDLGATLPDGFNPTEVPLEKVGAAVAGNGYTYKLYAASDPKQFSVTYNPNGGTWGDVDGADMENKQANKVVEGRTFPEGAELLTDLTREGFWLVGWSMQGNTETVDADRTKEEYSDFTLTAVWQPRIYRIEYDVNAANNNTAEGAPDITAPGNSYFVHPAAIPAVYDEGEDGTRTLKANLNSLGIRQGQLNADASWYAYGLPHPNNKDNALGYVFAGWSTDDREIGVKPDHGPWTNFQTDADMLATLFPSQTNDVPRGSSGESYQWGNNYARVYSTWLSYEAVPVTLGTDGPVGPATKTDGTGDGEAVSATALDGSATGAEPVKQTIYYWPEKGLVKGTYNNKQNTGEVVAASGDDLTLKGGMSLSAMGRYGYRFIGWGVRGEGYADDPDRSKCVVYAYYDEKGKTIKLTDAGAAKVAEWNAKPWKGSYDPADKEWTIDVAYAPTEWAALWEVRTYDVTLRLPASAVNSVKLNNGDYTWIEDRTTAGAPGANPSWYVGKKTWKYWDTLAVPEPKYNLNTGFNTYEGWYNDKEKMYDPTAAGAVSTDTAGRKVATESDVYKGTAFNVMKKTSVDGDGNAVTKPSGTWGNLFVEETRDSATRDQFGYTNATDKTRVADGEVELWLRYTPVYINATAPMGVWLANDEATGGAYVVGSDKRMHLETKASFTVKTDTTHDLVLTDVKATDIVSATTTQNGTGAADTVSDVVLDEGANTGANGKGFCETLLNVYSGNDDASKVYYDTDSSRMFWIAPESTVSYNATLGEANATADANEKRRYFGFGHVEGDNVLHGDAGVKGKENVLDAFRLKHGASTSAGGLGGLTVGSAGDGFKNYDFYYGLDLRRCKIDPSAAQTLLEASNKAAAEAGSEGGAWEYNEPHKQPLVRVMFTFAVERNELVSYSARMGETFDAAAVAASAGAVGDDEAPEVFVGPALS